MPRRRPDDVSALADRLAPVISWDELTQLIEWHQGEHVSLIGPTGCGKTRLALRLVEWRTALSASWHSIAIGTKPRDATLTKLVKRYRWRLVRQWPPPPGARRVVLWPPWRTPKDTPAQRAAITAALDGMFDSGGWCVFADEVSYLSKQLGLTRELEHVWEQGRSLGLSLVAATQRPAWVPRSLYSEASHVFIWRLADDEDRRRIGGLGGVPSADVRAIVATLDRHQALYVDTRSGKMYRTTAT